MTYVRVTSFRLPLQQFLFSDVLSLLPPVEIGIQPRNVLFGDSLLNYTSVKIPITFLPSPGG